MKWSSGSLPFLRQCLVFMDRPKHTKALIQSSSGTEIESWTTWIRRRNGPGTPWSFHIPYREETRYLIGADSFILVGTGGRRLGSQEGQKLIVPPATLKPALRITYIESWLPFAWQGFVFSFVAIRQRDYQKFEQIQLKTWCNVCHNTLRAGVYSVYDILSEFTVHIFRYVTSSVPNSRLHLFSVKRQVFKN
jgi:hypothetical protein